MELTFFDGDSGAAVSPSLVSSSLVSRRLVSRSSLVSPNLAWRLGAVCSSWLTPRSLALLRVGEGGDLTRAGERLELETKTTSSSLSESESTFIIAAEAGLVDVILA